MPDWGWAGAFAIVALGFFLVWLAYRRAGRPRRYFLGGAADPYASNAPAPSTPAGTPVTVEESGHLAPDEYETAPVPPEEVATPEGSAPPGEPAREDSPGWTPITSPPPTSEGPSTRGRRPGSGGQEGPFLGR